MASQADREDLGIQGFKDSKRYEEVRPDYPREAVKALMIKVGVLNENGGAVSDKSLRILELGAGTGKFTRVMADVLKDADVHIIASDPVKEMCEQFTKVLPDIEIKQFSADNIGLTDESIDVVVAANCFHWFNSQESLLEINRILTPKGMLGLIWSYPDNQSESWIEKLWQHLDLLFLNKNPFGVFPLHQEEILEVIVLSEEFSKLQRDSFKSMEKCTSDSFKKFIYSFSVIQMATPKEKAEFEEFYKRLMKERLAETGKDLNSVDYITPIIWCQKL